MSGPAQTLGELLLARAASHRHAEAVADGSVSLTYDELARAALSAARRLRELGVDPGDRVALQGRNDVAWVVVAFGVLLAGATVVPLGHHLPMAAVAEQLERTPARLLVTADASSPAGSDTSWVALADLADRADPWLSGVPNPAARPVDPGAEALVLLSSGTTGDPKAVAMSHRQLLRVYTEVVDRLGLEPGDRLLGAVPLAHSFGFNGVLLVSVLAGAMVRLVPSYDRRALPALVIDDRLDVVSGPPTLLRDLVAVPGPAGGDASATDREPLADVVRLVVTGSSEVSVEELRRISRRLGDPRVVVGYGMSETCGTVALTDGSLDGDHAWMRPLSGTEVEVRADDGSPSTIGSEGALLVRGENVAPALGTDSRLDADGWFHTGDLGLVDDRGLVAVVGRVDDRIMVGGFSVHPAVVERALLAHPGVEAAVVVGVPDERRGMRLIACVVPAAGTGLEGLAQHLRGRLSRHELPSEYLELESLPLTHTGKPSRRELGRRLGLTD